MSPDSIFFSAAAAKVFESLSLASRARARALATAAARAFAASAFFLRLAAICAFTFSRYDLRELPPRLTEPPARSCGRFRDSRKTKTLDPVTTSSVATMSFALTTTSPCRFIAARAANENAAFIAHLVKIKLQDGRT
jgi:hypothetical protein